MILALQLALSLALPLVLPAGSAGVSPRIQYLGAKDIPGNVGCVGFSPGASDMQTLFAWAHPFFVIVKVDGRVESLKLGKTTESHAQQGPWRRGDRIRQEFSSDRLSAVLDLVMTKHCLDEEGCKTGTSYEGELTIQVRGSSQAKAEKTIRVEIYCGC